MTKMVFQAYLTHTTYKKETLPIMHQLTVSFPGDIDRLEVCDMDGWFAADPPRCTFHQAVERLICVVDHFWCYILDT